MTGAVSEEGKTARGSDLCVRCNLRNYGICKALVGNPPLKERMALREDGKLVARRRLHRPTDDVSEIRIVRDGWMAGFVPVSGRGRVIASIFLPGDLIGGGVLLTGRPFFTVEAINDVEYCSFDKGVFVELLKSDSKLRKAMDQFAADSIHNFRSHIVDVAGRSAEEWVLSFLLNLYDRAGTRGLAQHGSMAFPLKQHHLADVMGLTAVHVNRVLKKLQTGGVIMLNRQVLTIANVEEVRKFVA